MADRLPLRIVYVSGIPTIGEFQSGDTLGIEHGGTGTSSIAGLKDSLEYTLSSLYDVNIDYPGTVDNLSFTEMFLHGTVLFGPITMFLTWSMLIIQVLHITYPV